MQPTEPQVYRILQQQENFLTLQRLTYHLINFATMLQLSNDNPLCLVTKSFGFYLRNSSSSSLLSLFSHELLIISHLEHCNCLNGVSTVSFHLLSPPLPSEQIIFLQYKYNLVTTCLKTFDSFSTI